jgi:hypothetical protein
MRAPVQKTRQSEVKIHDLDADLLALIGALAGVISAIGVPIAYLRLHSERVRRPALVAVAGRMARLRRGSVSRRCSRRVRATAGVTGEPFDEHRSEAIVIIATPDRDKVRGRCAPRLRIRTERRADPSGAPPVRRWCSWRGLKRAPDRTSRSGQGPR